MDRLCHLFRVQDTFASRFEMDSLNRLFDIRSA